MLAQWKKFLLCICKSVRPYTFENLLDFWSPAYLGEVVLAETEALQATGVLGQLLQYCPCLELTIEPGKWEKIIKILNENTPWFWTLSTKNAKKAGLLTKIFKFILAQIYQRQSVTQLFPVPLPACLTCSVVTQHLVRSTRSKVERARARKEGSTLPRSLPGITSSLGEMAPWKLIETRQGSSNEDRPSHTP